MKIIPNTGNKYAINRNGIVYRLYVNGREPKAKIPYKTKNGYLFHRLSYENNKSKQSTMRLVHRLVAEMFIDNLESKPCVDHIDQNKENNDVSNLRWCTYHENMAYLANGGKSTDRRYVARGILKKAKEIRNDMVEIHSCIKQQHRELKVLKVEMDRVLLLIQKKDKTKYEGYKDISGQKFTTVDEMVKSVGKPVTIEGVGEFPSAGSAAKYIAGIRNKTNAKEISRTIRKYLGDSSRTLCTVYGFRVL